MRLTNFIFSSILVTVFFTTSLHAQYTLSPIYLQIGEEMCNGVEGLEEVGGSFWFAPTLQDELQDLLPQVSLQSRLTFHKTQGDSLQNVFGEEDRRSLELTAAIIEQCPAARERYYQQVIHKEAENPTILEGPEWRKVMEMAQEQVEGALKDENKTAFVSLYHALKDNPTITLEMDSLRKWLGDNEFDELLIADITRNSPTFFTRNELEEFDGRAIVEWITTEVTNPVAEFELQDDYDKICGQAEKLKTFDVENDLDPSTIQPDIQSLRLVAAAYSGNSEKPILEMGLGALIMKSLFTECEHFKKISRQAGLQATWEELQPTAEEKPIFMDIADKLCDCVGMGPEKGQECFTTTMAELGLTEENTRMGADISPKNERLMKVVMALMPTLAMSCQN